jgi:hypothetical protein
MQAISDIAVIRPSELNGLFGIGKQLPTRTYPNRTHRHRATINVDLLIPYDAGTDLH